MPTYQKCSKEVSDLADDLIKTYETHKPLIDMKVKIDFVFAFADENDKGQKINDALTKNGIKAPETSFLWDGPAPGEEEAESACREADRHI